MAVRKDEVQISIAFLTDESKAYAKLIQDNKAFISDLQKARKEGADLSGVVKKIADSGAAAGKVDLSQLAPAQLVARARQLQQVIQLIPQSAPEYKVLEAEYRAINTQLAAMREGTRGVTEGMTAMRIATSAFAGLFAAFSLQSVLESAKAWVAELFTIGSGLDTLRGKVSTVFGEAEGIVRGFAETNAAELGLAREQYVSLATAAGDLLKPMGFTEEAVAKLSVQLTDQAGILSEWSQGRVSAEESSQILTKALLGERDALNSLGIDIKDSIVQTELKRKGLDTLTGASRRQAEALITLEQITLQSASANEAFSKNGESQIRTLAQLRAKLAEISQGAATALVPVFNFALQAGTKIIEWAIRFVQTLAAIPAFVSENRVAIIALVTALVSLNAQGIAAAANTLRVAAVQKAATIATYAQAAAQRVLNLAMTANPIGLVVAALGAIVAALVTAYQHSETFRRIVSGAFSAVTEVVKNMIGFFGDLGSGLFNLFTGNFSAALDSFKNAANRLNPFEVGKKLKGAFVEGYESVKSPPAPEVKSDTGAAKKEGAKVGQAMSEGFESQFDALRATGEKGAEAIAAGLKKALDLRLKDIEVSFLKEELVADRQLFKKELSEGQHAKRILELKEKQYRDQLAAFARFNQSESREALEAQKKLQEVQATLASRPSAAPLAPLATTGPQPVKSLVGEALKDAEVSSADDQVRIVQEKTRRILDLEGASELMRLDLLRLSLNNRLQVLRDAGLTETAEFTATLKQKEAADAEYQKTLVDNEQRTADLKKAIQEQSVSAAGDLFGAFADLLGQDEAARKKNGGAIKAFQTAQVIVQGVSEVQKIWAGAAELGPIAGPIIGAIQTAVAVARTAIAINKINAAKFAGGGYTGIGVGIPDNTGHRPVGVVHEREWVGPRWMVESPQYAPTFQFLESIRQRGFAQGGYSTTPAPAVSGVPLTGANSEMMAAFAMMSDEVRGMRDDLRTWRGRLKADVVYTDIEDVGAELATVREDAGI